MVKFYFALIVAKFIFFALKLLKRNASYLPGNIALKICPDFLDKIEKPKKIIGVTGTNGKTTVSNMIIDILESNGYKVLNNRYGSNMNTGITASFIAGTSFFGKNKNDIAVFEMDERSTVHIFKYIKPDYLIVNNLSRDSLKRNAHTSFIANVINNAIPKETTIITNGDDPICVNLASENKKIYFGISKLDSDTINCENIVRDMVLCPKCNSRLEYDWYRYHHIGKMHCIKCDFKSPELNYEITKIDSENKIIKIKEKSGNEYEFTCIADGIINIYNMLSAISVLRELGIEEKNINTAFSKMQIVNTRFMQEEYCGKKIVAHLAKGQNPIACSRAFDYVRRQKENKTVFLLLDDLHEKNEYITWLYDADYEFFNQDNIEQIIVSGKRYKDVVVRLLIAGISKEKIFACTGEKESVEKFFRPQNIDSVYVLYDLYSIKERNEVLESVKEILKKGENANED